LTKFRFVKCIKRRKTWNHAAYANDTAAIPLVDTFAVAISAADTDTYVLRAVTETVSFCV